MMATRHGLKLHDMPAIKAAVRTMREVVPANIAAAAEPPPDDVSPAAPRIWDR